MKKLIIVLAFCMGIFLAGCTPTEDIPERHRRIAQITDLQLKMAVEDWDWLWLYERNAGTTQWHPWIGI